MNALTAQELIFNNWQNPADKSIPDVAIDILDKDGDPLSVYLAGAALIFNGLNEADPGTVEDGKAFLNDVVEMRGVDDPVTHLRAYQLRHYAPWLTDRADGSPETTDSYGDLGIIAILKELDDLEKRLEHANQRFEKKRFRPIMASQVVLALLDDAEIAAYPAFPWHHTPKDDSRYAVAHKSDIQLLHPAGDIQRIKVMGAAFRRPLWLKDEVAEKDWPGNVGPVRHLVSELLGPEVAIVFMHNDIGTRFSKVFHYARRLVNDTDWDEDFESTYSQALDRMEQFRSNDIAAV